MAQESRSLLWDGRDSSGRNQPTGACLFVPQAALGKAFEKITLLR